MKWNGYLNATPVALVFAAVLVFTCGAQTSSSAKHTFTPDVIPYISPVGTLPGLTVATGFSGHGFGIGPAAGRLAAELAIGTTPSVDPTPFRASRFSDGSPIVIGPEI